MTADQSAKLTSDAIAVEQASRMLRLGLHGPARPVDKLLDRLGESDGENWLRNVLAMEEWSVLASVPNTNAQDAPVIEQLTKIKDAGKMTAVRGGSPETSLRAMVGYFFAIAGAFALFQTNISSRSATELEPILIDLASVAPPEWSGVFERAWSHIATGG